MKKIDFWDLKVGQKPNMDQDEYDNLLKDLKYYDEKIKYNLFEDNIEFVNTFKELMRYPEIIQKYKPNLMMFIIYILTSKKVQRVNDLVDYLGIIMKNYTNRLEEIQYNML